MFTPWGINLFRPAIPKTGAYVGENRKLGAIFCAKGRQEIAETNAPAPTVQLQRIRAVLGVIAYRKLNFRVTNVSRAVLISEPLKRETYTTLPSGVEKENAACDLSKPQYCLRTSYKDWCEASRDFLAEECGGGSCIVG